MIKQPDETYNDKKPTPPREHTTGSQREHYKTGDGDTPVYIRPGALDYKKLPSRGQK